jgi:hypothetical protein
LKQRCCLADPLLHCHLEGLVEVAELYLRLADTTPLKEDVAQTVAACLRLETLELFQTASLESLAQIAHATMAVLVVPL